MNYWQFKFKNEKVNFKELENLLDGDVFFTEITENKILQNVNLGTIIFWDRTDKEKGIILVTKMISNPYECDELSSNKAVALKVIKKFDKPFQLEKNSFKKLHDKLNTTKLKGRVRARTSIEQKEGERLLNKILPNFEEPNTKLEKINENDLKKTLKLFTDNYKQYQEDGENGYYYNIFIEANIAKQEIRHSAYLANLLKYNGSHFHENLFLRNFINEIKLYPFLNDNEVIKNFDIENYKVETEEYDDTKDEKGFMDIVIKDDNYMIIIENKTGTKDHTGQLVRYKDYAQTLVKDGIIKDYIILYLTPNGEIPSDKKAQNDEKIVSISYIDDIYNTMNNSLDDIKNETLKDIITQYKNSIPLYAYNLPINWEYELDTINIITQNIDTFKNCETITRLVNYNLIDKYNFSNEEIDISKWIANLFIKSKAKIERDFFVELHNTIKDELLKQGFSYDINYSNVLTQLASKLEMNTTIMNDINSIYYANKNRINNIKQNKDEEYYESMRNISKTKLVYKNEFNQDLFITINSDLTGFYLFVETENIVKDVKYLFDIYTNPIISYKISNLLNNNNEKDIINQCLTSIQNILKENF